jgi:hypothetical protein
MKSRAVMFFVVTSVLPLAVVGCPDKNKGTPDTGPAPSATPTPTPTETALAPLVEDAGEDVVDAGPDVKKYTGPGMNTNQLRVKQCCNALRNQAKSMGTAPEAANLTSAAALCDQLAMGVGPSTQGQIPELAPLRQMLQGKTIPPLCQGL